MRWCMSERSEDELGHAAGSAHILPYRQTCTPGMACRCNLHCWSCASRGWLPVRRRPAAQLCRQSSPCTSWQRVSMAEELACLENKVGSKW